MDSRRNEMRQNIPEKMTIIQSFNIITSAQSSSENQVQLASQQTSG
jgi:hypothetical protein